MTTPVLAKYAPAIQSAVNAIPYTAPEIMGTMLYERLVYPLAQQIDTLTAELDRLRTAPATPIQAAPAGAPRLDWRRPADDTPAPGCPVLACYKTAPALVYITRDTHVWADWTTGIEEPVPDYWAELPAPPAGEA